MVKGGGELLSERSGSQVWQGHNKLNQEEMRTPQPGEQREGFRVHGGRGGGAGKVRVMSNNVTGPCVPMVTLFCKNLQSISVTSIRFSIAFCFYKKNQRI